MKAHRSSDFCRRSRAFTITEMLFILMIFGVAGVVSMRLFAASMRVIRTAPDTQAHAASIDRLSFTLHRDVWGAKSIDLPDDRTIVLSEPDSATIRWHFSDADVTRTDSAGDRRWPTDLPLHAERRDNALVLRISSDRSDRDDELYFPCQSLSASGAHQ
ncbi:MAG TPA: hypothetical protein VHS31_04240 [Tepidisphaeraceae bacterium]|jgi:hypothetical protein|nr:hypothetical protein [Tepidisphaeraceae bacterium]